MPFLIRFDCPPIVTSTEIHYGAEAVSVVDRARRDDDELRIRGIIGRPLLGAMALADLHARRYDPQHPDALPAVRHLPGKHNQLDHGGGRRVRKLLAAARSLGEVEQAFKSEARRLTGRDIAADMKGSDLQIAREHSEGILRGLERFPKSLLGRVETFGPGGATERLDGNPDESVVARTRGGSFSRPEDVISFNVRYAGDPDGYRAMLKTTHAGGWLATDSPVGVALHEYGHVVGGHGSAYYRAGQAARAAAGSARASDYVREHISSYATASDGELAAESFAAVMTQGDSASELAHAAFVELEREYAHHASGR